MATLNEVLSLIQEKQTEIFNDMNDLYESAQASENSGIDIKSYIINNIKDKYKFNDAECQLLYSEWYNDPRSAIYSTDIDSGSTTRIKDTNHNDIPPDVKPEPKEDPVPDTILFSGPIPVIPTGVPPTPPQLDPVLPTKAPIDYSVPTTHINEWTTRGDQYAETRYLENDYYHAHGERDINDIGDQDKALEDIEMTNVHQVESVKKGENISHHYHHTHTDDYTIDGKTISYLPGQMVDLSSTPENVKAYTDLRETYKSKNLLYNTTSGQDYRHSSGKMSDIEYVATFASSGKYSVQDLFYTTNAISNKSKGYFGNYDGPIFGGTEFEKFFNDNAGINYQDKANKYKEEVSEIEKGFLKVHELLSNMAGEASSAFDKHTVECIIGKFEDTMGNINSRLDPAVGAITQLLGGYSGTAPENSNFPFSAPAPFVSCDGQSMSGRPLLEQLRDGEKILYSYQGKGADGGALPSGVTAQDPNVKDLTEELYGADGNGGLTKRKQELEEGIKKIEDDLAKNPEIQPHYEYVTNDAGKQERKGPTNSAEIAARAAFRAALSTALSVAKAELAKIEAEITEKTQKLTELQEKVDKMRASLNDLLKYAMLLMGFIKNYETTTSNYKKMVTQQSDGSYIWGKDENGNDIHISKLSDVVNNHDAIIHEFEDTKKMPVISNKSDYKVGDVVAYDDAHGWTSQVTEGFDPLTGTIKIACFDGSGRKIGSDMTIWDQREIAPLSGVEKYDDFYKPTTAPQTTTPHYPGPTPTPSTTAPPATTSPQTTVPQTTTPETIPETTVPPETTAPAAETIPGIPVFTIPYGDIIFTGPGGEPIIPSSPTPGSPTPGYNPDAPHTGLDSIYNTGETKQSVAGLGALAGLAAGAAGLGLTGLIGDRKEKEDEEEEEKEAKVQEIGEEKKEPEEEQKNDNLSNPQFF